MALFAIKQIVDAGGNFTGVAPDGVAAADANGVRTYPWGTVAGLWTFPTAASAYDIVQMIIKFGGQSSWTLSLVDGTTEIPIQTGTTETTLFYFPTRLLPLLPGATLKLVTAGASTAMEATVLFSPSQLGQS